MLEQLIKLLEGWGISKVEDQLTFLLNPAGDGRGRQHSSAAQVDHAYVEHIHQSAAKCTVFDSDGDGVPLEPTDFRYGHRHHSYHRASDCGGFSICFPIGGGKSAGGESGRH